MKNERVFGTFCIEGYNRMTEVLIPSSFISLGISFKKRKIGVWRSA